MFFDYKKYLGCIRLSLLIAQVVLITVKFFVNFVVVIVSQLEAFYLGFFKKIYIYITKKLFLKHTISPLIFQFCLKQKFCLIFSTSKEIAVRKTSFWSR